MFGETGRSPGRRRSTRRSRLARKPPSGAKRPFRSGSAARDRPPGRTDDHSRSRRLRDRRAPNAEVPDSRRHCWPREPSAEQTSYSGPASESPVQSCPAVSFSSRSPVFVEGPPARCRASPHLEVRAKCLRNWTEYLRPKRVAAPADTSRRSCGAGARICDLKIGSDLERGVIPGSALHRALGNVRILMLRHLMINGCDVVMPEPALAGKFTSRSLSPWICKPMNPRACVL